MSVIFITGIGTDVGKSVAAAILTEALETDYWKPIQAGFDNGTDAEFIQSNVSNRKTVIYPETYKLKLATSPHIAARKEGIKIDLETIYKDFKKIINNQNSELRTDNSKPKAENLIIEGAGGLLVPLNDDEFVLDLIKKLNTKVVLVSRNYLGSINHSLLTAKVCKENNIDVLGWLFNDQYMHYEEEIVRWSGYPKIASVPFTKNINKDFIKQQAMLLKESIHKLL